MRYDFDFSGPVPELVARADMPPGVDENDPREREPAIDEDRAIEAVYDCSSPWYIPDDSGMAKIGDVFGVGEKKSADVGASRP